MINASKIKEEGRAGLIYAYDSDGKLTHANDSINGHKYTCPICGCGMHPTTTKGGKRIFARNSGEVHTNPICISIESNQVKHSFEKLTPESLMTSLCYTTPRKKGTSGGGPVNPEPGGGGSVGGDDGEIKSVPFSSLKQIAEAGLDYLKADDMQGEYKISDFIMTYKFAGEFFKDPQFSLGARIIYARYAWVSASTQSIVFSMYSKRDDFSVRIRLIFQKKNEYKKYRDKFGKYKENESGKTVFVNHNADQYVLIASDNWAFIPKNHCPKYCLSKDGYCDKCCGMYQAVFTSTKQIYLIPADH